MLRKERVLSIEEFRANVLVVGHKGHPGKEEMVRQLRKSIWWPCMEKEEVIFGNLFRNLRVFRNTLGECS